jgi:uncharacterized LabA/DUF88 family protein
VTTQNTHQEQYDVDANVVEYPSAPETTAAPEASDANLPAETEAQANAHTLEAKPEEQVPSPEAAPATSDGVEDKGQATTAPTAPHSEVEEQNTTSTTTESDQPETANVAEIASADQSAQVTTVQETIEEAPTYTYTTDIPLTEVEAEVRPFTDFIEEFRQAEARLQASVQESETEVFHAMAPAVTALEQEVLPGTGFLEETIAPESVIASIDEARIETAAAFPQAGPALIVPEIDVESEVSKDKENMAKAEIAETSENNAANETPVAQVEQTTSAVEEETSASKPAERAVSPLLRPPTSRLRLSRHGTMRHPLREAATDAQPEAEWLAAVANKAEEVAPAAPATPAPQVEAEIAAVEEKAAETEKPKPARRYRFDRPAASTNHKPVVPPTTPVRNEEPPATPAPAARSENVASPSDISNETTTKPAANAAPQQAEQNVKAPAVEAPAAESANGAASTGQEHSRRRQSHERNKEQTPAPVPAPAPAAEAPVPPTETPAKAREVAPEDLPPLEYAELQKVSSRRRRRHRSGSSNGVAAPTPIQNPAPATPAPAAPRPAETNTITPATPPISPTSPQQYTIVSGYTVSQMNQGNEASGPFMAPEPSPARGSLITSNGRVPSRSEVQRGPAPTYPHMRPASEAGLTSAALNHFGNTIVQAIQAQTDRMVAELHRATQTPANISVSLPPFPSNERVGVFVDVANLLYSARTLNLAIDFGKLLDFLRGNRRLIRAQAYCPTSPQPGAEQMFLQAVKGLGYRITTKHYKTFSSGAKKADLDLDLCMDVVRLVDGRAVDCIVLVSGDSDFMPMLDYCSDHGVRVEVAAFDEAMSATLRQSCDLFINLSMLDEVLARV